MSTRGVGFLLGEQSGARPGLETLHAHLPAGACCFVDVRQLHPTQISAGLGEVRLRAARLQAMAPDDQERYLRGKEVPVVIGPGGVPFIVDRHHLARLLLDTNLRSQAYAVVRANWSDLPPDEFWQRMRERHWVYLFDEHGHGPLSPNALPKSVADLKDDPYRTLAYLVRKRGGFAQTESPFAEFQWANFLRAHIPESALSNLESATTLALKLAVRPEASTLPGYTGAPLPPGQTE